MCSQLTKISSKAKTFNFGYLLPPHTIYVTKDAKIPDYYLKPKVARQQNLWETLLYMIKNCFMYILHCTRISW